MDTFIKAFSEGFKGENCKLKIGGDGSQRNGLEILANKSWYKESNNIFRSII